MKKVLIIGAGAMGLLYGSQLKDSGKIKVFLGATEKRYLQLVNKDFLFNGKAYSFEIVNLETKDFKADLIIVAVKFNQLSEIIKEMKNVVGNETVIVSLLNGLDSEEEIAKVYTKDKVVYSITVGMDSVRNADGTVVCKNFGKLVFGDERNIFSEKVKRLKEIFDISNIAYEISDNILRSLWWKFMVNVGVNQASAVMELPYGAFQQYDETRKIMLGLMGEVVEISKYEGINLMEDDISKFLKVLNSLSAQGKTSMFQDVQAKRETEVEIFAGKVIALGKKYGLKTPYNKIFYEIIKGIEATYEVQ